VQLPGYAGSYNRYSYCLNNPLKYVDLSGLQIEFMHEGSRFADPPGAIWLTERYHMGSGGGNNRPFGGIGMDSYRYDRTSPTGYRDSSGNVVSWWEVYYSYILPNSIITVIVYVQDNNDNLFRGVHFEGGGTWYTEDGWEALTSIVVGVVQSGGDKGSWWSDFWNNSTIAKVIPDVIYINQGAVYNFVGGGAYTTGIALKIRGGNEGMRIYSYVSLIAKAGAHGNVGLNVGYSSYVGDARNFNFEESFGGNGTRGFDWDILFGIGGTVSPVDSSGGLLYSYDVGFGPSIGASANIGSTTYILGKWPK